jgi:hypothetical protein
VLLGFCSLAVDLGRVQAVKTELEIATDAAARAGAGNLPISSTSISISVHALQTAAVNMAAQNNADGVPVTITSSNVNLYNWPSTTPLTGTAAVNANAVNVQASLAVPLLFAQVLGMPTATVHASSTAYLNTVTNYGLVGTNTVQLQGGTGDLVDSYNSSLGPYGPTNMSNQGSIAGDIIEVNGGSTVNGNIYYYGGTRPNTSGGTVNGTISTMSSQLSYPTPTIPPGCTNLGAVSLTNGQSLTLNSGNYSATSMYLEGTSVLNVNATNGPVNLYMSGEWFCDSFPAGGAINFTSTIPNNFHIYATTSDPVYFRSGTIVYCVVDAPLSTVQVTYGGALYGSVIANTLFSDVGAAIHYDQALGVNGVTHNIEQVQ